MDSVIEDVGDNGSDLTAPFPIPFKESGDNNSERSFMLDTHIVSKFFSLNKILIFTIMLLINTTIVYLDDSASLVKTDQRY